MSQTKDALMKVLLASVSSEDYLQAENMARGEEMTFGTLTDLRNKRDEMMKQLTDLAFLIDGLDDEVQGILCSRRKTLPSNFDTQNHSHLITQRVPADDEHP